MATWRQRHTVRMPHDKWSWSQGMQISPAKHQRQGRYKEGFSLEVSKEGQTFGH